MTESSAYNLAEIKAVIVDDQDPIRKAMKRILASMGIVNIIECFDGKEALKELSRHPDIDLILIDIYMRKVNGFDVLHYIRSRAIRADIPVIIVTGEASKEDIVKASDMGADDYIIKPFQAESMTSKVNQVLHKFYSPAPAIQKLREGDRHMMAKQIKQAAKLYQEAMELDPSSLRARHSYAVSLFRCKRIDKAISLLNENIKESATYYRNYATLADIYVYKKDYSDAIHQLSKELEYNPKQPARQNLIARLLLAQNDTVGAIEHFRETLREDVKDKEALLGIGEAFALSDDINKAVYYFKRLRRYYPNDSKSMQAIITYCIEAGELKKAEAFFREERKAHPERLDAHIYLGRFYLTTGRYAEAAQALEPVFKIDREHPEAWKVKAAIEMKQKNYQKAKDALSTVVKRSPEVETYLALAECMQRLKEFKPSIAVLHRALFIAPNNPSALFLIAQALKKSKQITKALLLYKVARKCGADPKKCNKNMKICWDYIRLRRKNAFKISA
ncbi:MAG: tetratricopeptide repeat protein [Oligoflexales bacterium]|nr:tetratricopeptide repeat protein [Oligoflexales bacterium]